MEVSVLKGVKKKKKMTGKYQGPTLHVGIYYKEMSIKRERES